MLFAFENLYRQYLCCRRNKRNTLNALRFEARQEEQLLDLREALTTHTYRPSRSVCFFATAGPKPREIFAADFRDRVVHYVLVDYLEQDWEPRFIHDSYACRRGKGVHAGVARLQQFLRQVTANGVRPAWYLQLDIQNYFLSIDKDILYHLIAARLKDDDARWLAQALIYHDCTEDYLFRGRPEDRHQLPPHKTLCGRPKHQGLPLGNLNSQFFANVYLDGLDQFIKHQLKCRYYLRYCDDFVLLSPEREQLLAWRDQIATWLREQRRLELNARRQRLRPVSNGIDFLGYIVRSDYRLVRRRVVNKLRVRLREYQAQLVEEGSDCRRYRFDRALLDRLHATLASYLGHLQQANTYHLCQTLWEDHPFLARYFDFDPQVPALVRKYPPPRGVRNIRQQYRYYRRRFPDAVLFFQVGRFIEFYQSGDKVIANWLGLAPLSANRRGARYGFPVALVNRYCRRLLERRLPVLLVVEQKLYLAGIQERTLAYRFEYLPTPASGQEQLSG